MNKIKKFLNSPIVFSVLLNAAVLLVSVTLFKPFFEENDDALISMIAEGAYGTRETHLIYTNVILGSIYKCLYSVSPAIRWHAVIQYAFLFIAFTALTYIIQYSGCHGTESGIKNRMNKSMAAILVLSMFYEVYVSIQYSKTAVTVCAIGYVLLLYGAGMKEEKLLTIKRASLNILEAVGFILLIYGMMLRDSSFLLASLLMLPVCLYEFISSVRRKFRIYILIFAPVLIWFIAVKAIDANAYRTDAAWKGFMEYNDTRMDLLDYRYDLMDRNKYGDRLEAEGISENDALIYLTWQFGDDSVLDTQKMKEILKDAPPRWSVVSCLKALAQHIYEDVLILDPMIVGTLFILIFAAMALYRSGNRVLLLLTASQMIVFCGILVYYEYCGRWSHRIVFAALLAMMISLLRIWMISCDVKENTDVYRCTYEYAYAVVILSCISVLLGNRLDYNKYVREMPDYSGFFKSISGDKDTLYIADTFTFQYAYKYDVFKSYGEGSLDNFVVVGSWFVNSPLTRGITTRYGYSNPVRALAMVSDAEAEAQTAAEENTEEDGLKTKRVVLVDNMYPEEKLLYINEHYGDLYKKQHVERAFDKGPDEYGLQQYIVK